jgi:hypothetical protein
MYKVIDFYEPLSRSDAERYERGQFWWACFPYAFTKPQITRFWPNRPTETLDVRRFDPRKEQPDDVAHTSADEFLAITQFKRRPVVILSTAGSLYHDRAWRGGDFFLVAPVRSLRDTLTGEYKANPNFVWGAITYRFSSVFYLPRDATFDIREGVLHFDRMTTLHRTWLLEPRKAHLSSDAMVCLDEWLRNYLYNEVRARFNDDLETYRQMVGSDPQVRTGLFGRSRVV